MSLSLILAMAGTAFSAVIAGLVLWRAPRHPAHVCFTIGMLLLSAENLLAVMPGERGNLGSAVPLQIYSLGIAALVSPPWLMFSLCYARGDYRTSLRRWWSAVLTLVTVPIILLGRFHGQLFVSTDAEGVTRPDALRLGWAGTILSVMMVGGSVMILTNLERTFRTSVGVMRWRIKYMVLGVGLLFVLRLYTASQSLLYGTIDPLLPRLQAAVLLLACGLISVALVRAKLFDVDVYPSHAVLFRSLTVLLAGIYLLVVGFFAQVVRFVGRDMALPLQTFLILLALLGLAVGLLSERIRRRLHLFVSRHFQRPVYDYRNAWMAFTAQTASQVDESAFCRSVVNWVAETFQVLSVNLWLLSDSEDRLRLGASTALSEESAARLEAAGPDWKPLIDQMVAHPHPVDIDVSSEGWIEGLRKLNPGFFPEGGNRVCMPLCAGGELLGVVMLGDRVAGLPFSTEDFDLIKCVGDQAAGGLLGLRLSKRLLRAKELEAFQTMSAFFVHDLKNTASTLSLMLQNLGEHFGNPDFREDALRAVGKSVRHLDELIGRLGLLRQELRLQPIEARLADVVELALAEAGPMPQLQVITNLPPSPVLRLDPGQIQKVVLNLVLNARDSIAGNGEIRVTTGEIDGWAQLTVADTGSGMTPEFLRRSLFRPFQTTKKRGLGIGMFQSKTIVDAHGGRIEVDSAPGKGTTFRVLLPRT